MKKILISSFVLFVIFGTMQQAHAVKYDRSPELKLYDTEDMDMQKSWNAYSPGFKGGVSVAIGDVNGDGFEEIITGAGPGGGPHVIVYTTNGYMLSHFFAYDRIFDKGIMVATADTDGDGSEEIIVGARQGGGPHVQVFDIQGNLKNHFFAFDKDFRGGVNIAGGDVTGDDREEIIVGAGPTGGPHVRVFGSDGTWTGMDYFPFGSGERGGVSVATAQIEDDDKEEIIMGLYSNGESWVKIYKANTEKTVLGEWMAFPQGFQGGVNVGSADVDQDGLDEVVVAAGIMGGPHVRLLEVDGSQTGKDFFAYESEFRGGVFVAGGDTDQDGIDEVVTAPGKKYAEGRTDLHKYIEVDISDQILKAYENGHLKFEFLTSTGTTKYPTPTGDFTITGKIESTRMTHEYGPDHPDNYDLENVPHVLAFNGPYTIHGAYWHNNFGYRMSHGCVNLSLPDAAAIYPWADYGTPVFVKD